MTFVKVVATSKRVTVKVLYISSFSSTKFGRDETFYCFYYNANLNLKQFNMVL